MNEQAGSTRQIGGPTPGLTAETGPKLELEEDAPAFAVSYLPLVALFADRFREDIEPHLSCVPEGWAYADRVVALLSQELRRDVAEFHQRRGGDLASLLDPSQIKNLDAHLTAELHRFLHRLWALPRSARSALAPPKPAPRVRQVRTKEHARPARQASIPHFQVVLSGDGVVVEPLEEGQRVFTPARLVRVVDVLTRVFSYHQRDFLSSGVHGLRAMTLAQVAEWCGIHESTVSRLSGLVVVGTPHGVYPLKWFFASSLLGYDGRTVSSRAAKDLVRATVEEWASRGEAISDHEIARALRGKGVGLSRRTVAKYRAELGIGAARTRLGAPAADGSGLCARLSGVTTTS